MTTANKENIDKNSQSDQYTPGSEELAAAISFMRICSNSDLLHSWRRACLEWDLDSVVTIHKSLVQSRRIECLVAAAVES
tara:strand:+ start:166 stop:405 length:240 start_codon:yes stop_codon:yes gene_type:complete